VRWGSFDNEYKSDLASRLMGDKMPRNKAKTEKQLETQTKTEIVEELPKIKAMRKNSSKYEQEFQNIPEGKFLKVEGKTEISRYFGALKRFQKQGKFQDLECHQRTMDNEVYGYIGHKDEKK